MFILSDSHLVFFISISRSYTSSIYIVGFFIYINPVCGHHYLPDYFLLAWMSISHSNILYKEHFTSLNLRSSIFSWYTILKIRIVCISTILFYLLCFTQIKNIYIFWKPLKNSTFGSLTPNRLVEYWAD